MPHTRVDGPGHAKRAVPPNCSPAIPLGRSDSCAQDYVFVYVAPGRLLGSDSDGRLGLFDSINDDNDVRRPNCIGSCGCPLAHMLCTVWTVPTAATSVRNGEPLTVSLAPPQVSWFNLPEGAPANPKHAHGGQNGYDDRPMREYLVELK